MRFSKLGLLFPIAASLVSFMHSSTVRAQSGCRSRLDARADPRQGEVLIPRHRTAVSGPGLEAENPPEPALPAAPEPASWSGSSERANVPWAGVKHQQPFSRVGIGAGISPLGVGFSSSIVLTRYFDARFMGNFFSYASGNFEIQGFRVDANLHMASAATSVDWYPLNSVFRLSAGMLFYNRNRISVASRIVPGTSFTFDGETFYSASPDPATGATPLSASGVLGLHTHQPAFTLSGGFGKFIPRSYRHWSFPFEIGAAFIGPPTVNLNTAGWVCMDANQTRCSNLADSSNPVSIEFDNALQAQLAKWRKDLSRVDVYPLFSYSVVYSFNIR